MLVLSPVTIPARINTMLKITKTAGAAVDGEAMDVVESCTALAANAPDEEAESEVK